MSTISQCHRCGGNIIKPSWEGDGVYPVGRMCECAYQSEQPPRVTTSRPVREIRWAVEDES